jgi:outer membrane protein OmpA-like peptidoglycan-associated protein
MDDRERPTDMRLSAVLNGFSQIDVSGWAKPFAASPSFDVLAQIKDLELPPLSPYAAQAVGVNIDGGRLNLKADAKAERAALDGLVQIDLRGLAFGALSKEDEERLSAKVGVPINTVVSLLQDAEGKIDLRVPISGNLASPDFDLSDAIGQAVTGAMTAAVTAPFKLIFEPVNMIAGGGSSGLSLKPVPFAAGEAALTPEGRVFIDSLAKLLQQRPKLTLRVCGKSTEQDVAALRARGALPQPTPGAQAANAQPQARGPQPDEQTRAELTRLAEERTRAVRQYLAERARLPVARIGECRAAFEPQSKAGPRAEASF